MLLKNIKKKVEIKIAKELLILKIIKLFKVVLGFGLHIINLKIKRLNTIFI